MVLTLLLEDEEGVWTLRLHPDHTWDLSRHRIDEHAYTVCQGSITPEGDIRGSTPQGAFPRGALDQFRRVLTLVCR
jgi:hypothetical protein